MTHHPVLFLDFVGVVHPYGETAVDEDFRLIENPYPFCWQLILGDILAPHLAVRIILSSDWRHLFDDECPVRLLGENLGAHFFGVVEVAKESRAEEI